MFFGKSKSKTGQQNLENKLDIFKGLDYTWNQNFGHIGHFFNIHFDNLTDIF